MWRSHSATFSGPKSFFPTSVWNKNKVLNKKICQKFYKFIRRHFRRIRIRCINLLYYCSETTSIILLYFK